MGEYHFTYGARYEDRLACLLVGMPYEIFKTISRAEKAEIIAFYRTYRLHQSVEAATQARDQKARIEAQKNRANNS